MTEFRDADPPVRFWEMSLSAAKIGAGPAAALAVRKPGLAGVIAFLAARGDSLHDVAVLLGLRYSDIERILANEGETETQDAL